MILALDVDYKEKSANAAGIVFNAWQDTETAAEYVVRLDNIEDYVPGSFYKRELPCLSAIVDIVKEPISIIVIDGYVWLNNDQEPGLGGHLFDMYNKKIPVTGVAKRSYYSSGNNCKEILRGESNVPLYITCAGIELNVAANHILNMAGNNRIPLLLKKVDSLCRNWKTNNTNI